jgi:hypothetical protein
VKQGGGSIEGGRWDPKSFRCTPSTSDAARVQFQIWSLKFYILNLSRCCCCCCEFIRCGPPTALSRTPLMMHGPRQQRATPHTALQQVRLSRTQLAAHCLFV